MLPTKAVRLQLGELLAADDTTLAPASDANKVHLVKGNFTPEENMTIDDLDFADFTGSTPLAAGTGNQLVGIDPATGDQILTIKEPAGGWRWECTADPSEPQTIYGYALTNLAGDELYGIAVLATPVTIREAGQEINLGTVKMTISQTPIS